MSKRPGFNLAELFAVLGFLAILGSILFPVFADRSRPQALASYPSGTAYIRMAHTFPIAVRFH